MKKKPVDLASWSPLGPKIKQVLSTGIWLSAVPAGAPVLLEPMLPLAEVLENLWRFLKTFSSAPIALIVFKKSGSTLTCH
jgi:hypothetical protein